MWATAVLRILIFTAIFVVIISATTTPEQGISLSVKVRPELPWYLDFSFESSAIEPLTLKAKHTRPSQKVIANEPDIEFAFSAGTNDGYFRNHVPQNFVENDVITADLEYLERSSGQKHTISFEYAIRNKAEAFIIADGLKTMSSFQVAEILPQKSSADRIFGVNVAALLTGGNIGSHPDCPNSDSDCEYQDELLRTAIEHGNVGTRLVLTGQQPPLTNAVDAIRTVIVDKLELRHLSFSILQAQFRGEEILFEMATPRNAIEVLTKARLLLKRSPFKIRSADMDFVDLSLLQRTKN